MAFPYVRHQANWQDGQAGGTPITEAALDTIEAGLDSLSDLFELAAAKGDLLAATGDNAWARLAVGANDEIPVADSAQSSGIVWKKIGNAMVASNAAIGVSKLAAGAEEDMLKTVGGVPVWDGGNWTSYTPSWTTAGTAPSLGNGTLTGKYRRIGKLLFVAIQFIAGSTTTFGTGAWTFSIPVTQSTASRVSSFATIFDSSAGMLYPAVARVGSSSTTMDLWNIASPMTQVTNTTPITWAQSDQVDLLYIVEKA